MNQNYLKSILDYNPETGLFTWKDRNDISPAVNSRTKGKLAGTGHPKGYRAIGINGKMYFAHRLAFMFVYGYFPEEIDHIDGNKDNNAIKNLRNVSRSGNMKNSPRRANNSSGAVGVSWDQARKKWMAQIVSDGKTVYGGRFKTKGEAIARRKELEREYDFHENHGR